MPLQFRDLSPETADDLLAFFEGPAFIDNAHWASCYCFFYHFTGDWKERTAAQNRAAKRERILTGQAHGVLAYEDGAVVGWCHAGPRLTLPLLWDGGEKEELEQHPKTAAVVCFVIDPRHRGQGLASALLGAAEESMRRLGMTELQGFPLPEVAGEKDGLSADARNYHGTLSMFQRAGFEERGASGPFFEVVKSL